MAGVEEPGFPEEQHGEALIKQSRPLRFTRSKRFSVTQTELPNATELPPSVLPQTMATVLDDRVVSASDADDAAREAVFRVWARRGLNLDEFLARILTRWSTALRRVDRLTSAEGGVALRTARGVSLPGQHLELLHRVRPKWADSHAEHEE